MSVKEGNTKNESSKKDQIDLCKRIWEGCVGVCIRPQLKKDGTYFWKYSLMRAFTHKGSDKWQYDSFFTMSNNEALAEALSQAMRFMTDTDPNQYVEKKYQDYLESDFPDAEEAA